MEETIQTSTPINMDIIKPQPITKKRGPKPKYITEEERIEARRLRGRETYKKNKILGFTHK